MSEAVNNGSFHAHDPRQDEFPVPKPIKPKKRAEATAGAEASNSRVAKKAKPSESGARELVLKYMKEQVTTPGGNSVVFSKKLHRLRVHASSACAS